MNKYNLKSVSMTSRLGIKQGLINLAMVIALLGILAPIQPAHAGEVGFAAPGGYGLKIYRVSSDLYPFVQVYFRTFDQQMQPLVNLNYMNIGLMVKGKSYDPMFM